MKPISTTPLPRVSDLGAFLRECADDFTLATPWIRKGDMPLWLSRSSWGMAAVASAASARLQREVTFWIPEYFCDQALWPTRQSRAALHFYPVDNQARPDWERIGSSAPRPDLFLLPHFFGHANDHGRARSFCDQAGALLIEDAAQALGACAGIGEDGDVVLYSPWKFFQIPNAALMLIRPRAAAWVDQIRRSTAELGTAVSPGFGWAKHAAISILGLENRRGSRADGSAFFADAPTGPMPVRPLPSPISKPLLSSVDVEDARQRRRQNDSVNREYFANAPGWTPWYDTPSQGPMRSVFQLDSEERVAAAYVALRSAGIQAEGWPTLPPEVDERASCAKRMRRTLINLPCHQRIAPAALAAALNASGAKDGMRAVRNIGS